MRRWPALESSCVRAYEVMPWMSVAMRTAPTIQGSSSWRCLVKTWSMSGRKDHGSTSAADPIDDHQEEAAGEEEPARLDERPDLRPDFFELRLWTLCGGVGGGGAASSAGRRISRAHAGCAAHV